MQNWDDLIRMAFAVLVLIVALIVLRLITGRREVAQMTSFDLVLLSAIGVILGAVLLLKSPTLGEGLLALAILILALQLNVRSPVREPIKRWNASFEPTLLLYKGRILPACIDRGRTTEEKVAAAAKLAGHRDPDEVEVIVLEPDGSMSVIGPREAASFGSPKVISLNDVKQSKGQP